MVIVSLLVSVAMHQVVAQRKNRLRVGVVVHQLVEEVVDKASVLFHAEDRKDAHAKVLTIQRRCVPSRHAVLLVPPPMVWQIARHTVVVCV